MNKKKIWEEVAASLNQEDFDKEIAAQGEPHCSRLREVHALLKNERKIVDLLLRTDTSKAWNRLKSGKTNTWLLIGKVLGYAACAMLLVASGYLLRSQLDNKPEETESYTVFSVPNAEMGNLVLADGTRVFLNSATTVRYNAAPSKQREVFLNGEAYFEVKADRKHPFLVHLDGFTIKVTGTRFNARSYDRCDVEEATLIEGEIAVLGPNGYEITTIQPNETLIFNKETHQISVDKTSASARTAWRSGKIYFKNKTIGEIAATLERWYDVRIEFENESIKQLRLTGTILKNKPIEQILEILKISEPVDFEYQYENQLLSTIKIKHMR